MNTRKRYVVGLCTVLLMTVTSVGVRAQESSSPGVPAIKVLIARPVDASKRVGSKARWVSALIQTDLIVRFSTLKAFAAVPRAVLERYAPAHSDMGRRVSEQDYFNCAADQGVTHIVNTTFEVTDKGANLQYYAELMTFPGKKILGSVEKSFPIQALGIELDDAIHRFVKLAGQNVSAEDEKLFQKSLLNTVAKELVSLGSTIADEYYREAPDHRRSARKYESFVQASGEMRICSWLAGEANMASGQYADAARDIENFLEFSPAFGQGYEVLGAALFEDRRYGDAIKVSQRAESAGVRTTALLVVELRSQLALKQRDGAYAAALKILEQSPNEPTALTFVARWRNDEGRAEEGLDLAERLLKVEPNNGHGFLEKGRALVELKRADEAVFPLTQATVLLPAEAEPRAILGNINFESKKYAKAAGFYEQALKVWSDSLDLFLRAADAFELASNKKAALALLKQIEPRRGNDRRLIARIGLLTFDVGDTLGSQPYLERCLKGSVDDPRIFMALAAGYARSNEYLKAIRMYEQAIPLVKDKSACRISLGVLFLKKGEPENALVYLERIAKDNPKYPQLYRYIGDAKMAGGDRKAALESYHKEIANNGADPYVQGQVARIQFENGNKAEAKNEALKLIKVDPANANAYYWLSSLYLDEKNLAKAQQYLKDGRARGGADEEMCFRLGKGYAKLKSYKDAEENFRKCIEFNRGRADAWEGLAAVLLSNGRDSAAAETYLHIAGFGGDTYVKYAVKAGKLFEQLKLADKARAAYNLFLGKGQTDDAVNKRLARLETDAGNNDAVVKLLGNDQIKESLSDVDIMRLARSLMALEKWEEAMPLLEKVAGTGASNPEALELAARCAVNTDNFEKAIALYERFLKSPLTARHSGYAFEVGGLLEKLDRGSQARKRYERNIEQYPREIRNYEALARLCTVHEDWECAEKTLVKAVTLSTATPQLRRMLAETYEHQNKRNKAIEVYNTYLARGEADSLALLALGRLLYEQHEYAKAVVPLNQAVMLMPGNFESAFMLGESYLKNENIASAVDAFVKARSINSKDVRVLRSLAECYRKQNDNPNLIVVLREWHYLEETNLDVKAALGKAFLAGHNSSEGTRLLEQVSRQRPNDVELHRILAETYKQTGDSKNQLAHLKAALNLDPNKGDLFQEMGRFYLAHNKRKLAMEHFKSAVDADPKLNAARFEYAQLLYESGAILDAYEQLKVCIDQDKYNVPYLVLFARAAFQIDKQGEAMAAVKGALARNPDDVDALSLAGFLYNKQYKSDTARQYLNRAVQLKPECAYCYQYLGDAYLYEGDYELAAKMFEKSLGMRAYDEESSVKLGKAVLLSGYPEKAGQLFEKILSLNPSNDEAFYWLCHAYIELGQVSVAQTLFKKFNLSKKTGWLHLAQGEIYEVQGKIDAALISFRVASRLMPGEPLTVAAAGRMNLVKKEFDEAVVNFGKALGKDPHNPRYLLQLGKAYEGLTDYSSALQLYGEIIQNSPNFVEAIYLSARALSKSGEHEKAIEMLEKAFRRNPSDPRISMALGHEYRMTENLERAIQAYEAAAKEGGKDFVEALRYVGSIYLEKYDNKKKAKKYFERYLKSGGSNDKVRELVQTLE